MNLVDIQGHLILLMAPSGSGKGTLITSLGDLRDEMYFLKTFTSRKPREGVTENPNYEFVSEETFKKLIEEDALVEWACFSGNYYGTPKSEVWKALMEGKVAFKEMELQGIMQMRKLVPREHMTVMYIDAGGWDALEKRILARSTIDSQELAQRKERYEEESKTKAEADVVIENHDGKYELAEKKFKSTIQAILTHKR